MAAITVNAGWPVVKKGEKLTQIYMVQSGEVSMQIGLGEAKLGKNSIIGIMTEEWFLCNYKALTDVVLVPIACRTPQEIKRLLASKSNYRAAFLNAAVAQRHQVLTVYFNIHKQTKGFCDMINRLYDSYQTYCLKTGLDEQPFQKMASLEPFELKHRAEDWEVANSNAIISKHLTDYLRFMQQDDALCVAAIMEAGRQQRRVIQGCDEMTTYLNTNKDMLLSDNNNDLFYLFFELAVRASRNNLDISTLTASLDEMCTYIKSSGLYDPSLVKTRLSQYEGYDFSNAAGGSFNTEIDIANEDCVTHILTFAGYDLVEMQEIKNDIEAYKALPDRMSTESDVYSLRRRITAKFYEIYEKVFFNTLVPGLEITPIIKMFLNFGFMDVELAGKEHSYELLDLTSKLDMFSSENVYTIYAWLKAILEGRKEPSKNEFDLDYFENLLDRRKSGDLTMEQVEEYKTKQDEKVRFEIQNLFQSGNKITYGRVTTFFPILCGEEMYNTALKMAVKAQDIADSFRYIRDIDYSLFFRDVQFAGNGLGLMENERMQQEILPDVILMPIVGTKANMWQEISGKRSNTPGRYVFPIFTGMDLNELMVETCGRFRWELCRRIQGVHWNDIRDKSLTAEYCDYLQFYRKNRELSAEGKEKIKTTLQQCRNSYREVFVKDYINWIKFEAVGSFRINKVSRGILTRYCPFPAKIRAELKSNPVYQNAFNKLEIGQQQSIKRYTTLYNKFEELGGTITEQMKENLLYYEM